MKLHVVSKSDGFGCATYGPVAIAAWDAPATVAQAQSAADMLASLGATEEVVYILAVLGPNAPPGDSDVRETIQAAIRRLGSKVGAGANVIEGQGFRAAAMRAALTGMGLVVRSSFPNKSFASITEAAGFLSGLSHGKFNAIGLVQAAAELRR